MPPNSILTYENIIGEIKTICNANYNDDDVGVVERVFRDSINLFEGRTEGFLRCDMKYHNISHTLQTIPPFIEIIDGWNRSKSDPFISKKYYVLGIIAVILHDTGYLKCNDDREGTGAKYTFTHVQRSIDFADAYLHGIGLDDDSIVSVQNAIRCTGVFFDNKVHFHSGEERVIGYALGTADLLGQMAAPDYVDKLPALYLEFEEAYNFEGLENLQGKGSTLFSDSVHLIANTPFFFEKIVMERFKMMGPVYTYLTYHYDSGENPYIKEIEKNLGKIKSIIAAQ
ncbi:MAG TPA: hypothetical protein PLX02_06475 [Syntrophorhabdaceae bacterium]|nr:hypothetical protein [Syntrophorhabdaceae bacterium]HQM81252.1 hypothetical protein [Syntrophorhabdaceae bacterium]